MKWGTYSNNYKFEHDGWYCEVAKFTSETGEEFWRYRKSRNKIVSGLWQDKNRQARKFDRRYYTNKQKAIDAAKGETPQ